MRVIVTGMRNWPDKESVWKGLNVATSFAMRADLIIIEGGAQGADAHARAWAECYSVKNISFAANWEKHGRPAGMIRNREMAQAGADVCLAFWDGKSRGTGNMIAVATEYGILTRVFPLLKVTKP